MVSIKTEKELKKAIKKEIIKKGIEINCPHCNKKIKVKQQTKTCPKCKTKININFEN